MKISRKSKVLIWLTAIVTIVAILAGLCTLYLSDYYKADTEVIAAFTHLDNIEITELESGDILYQPKQIKAGFVFYPGAKVEHTAYQPLMLALAKRGFMCILVKMPFNLAFLNQNAAVSIRERYSEIESWYIGGHSLGGAMAASCVSKHQERFDGLVLLGAYSADDLSETSVNVISIYGSEDKILNMENYEKYRDNFPENVNERIINGACHSYFGAYGKQEGDGEGKLTNIQQINITASLIALYTK